MKNLCYNRSTKEKERNKKCFNLSNKNDEGTPMHK